MTASLSFCSSTALTSSVSNVIMICFMSCRSRLQANLHVQYVKKVNTSKIWYSIHISTRCNLATSKVYHTQCWSQFLICHQSKPKSSDQLKQVYQYTLEPKQNAEGIFFYARLNETSSPNLAYSPLFAVCPQQQLLLQVSSLSQSSQMPRLILNFCLHQ